MRRWLDLYREEEGLQVIEWALVTLVVALAGAITLVLARSTVSTLFDHVLGRLLGYY